MGAAVSSALQDLGVERMLVAVSDLKKTPRWIGQHAVAHEVLLPQALQDRFDRGGVRAGEKFATWSLPGPRMTGRMWGARPGSRLT